MLYQASCFSWRYVKTLLMLLHSSGRVWIHQKGIHSAKWENMCAPREKEGIGFRMIHEFNLALLTKQLWRLIQFPDSLVARVLKGKHYHLSTPLRTGSVDNQSFVWTSIISARKLLLLGIRNKEHSGLKSICGRTHGFPQHQQGRLDRELQLSIQKWPSAVWLTLNQENGTSSYWDSMFIRKTYRWFRVWS